jgi:sec-independent protein translocase protein TatB
MFDVAPTELLVIAAVAVAVIPTKDLPKAMRFAGHWMGKARGMARHFRAGVDEMIRQSELDEMEKKWREENERIMREHPLQDAIEHPAEPVMTPLPAPAAVDAPELHQEPARAIPADPKPAHD